jgi:hypothetical protein
MWLLGGPVRPERSMQLCHLSTVLGDARLICGQLAPRRSGGLASLLGLPEAPLVDYEIGEVGCVPVRIHSPTRICFRFTIVCCELEFESRCGRRIPTTGVMLGDQAQGLKDRSVDAAMTTGVVKLVA